MQSDAGTVERYIDSLPPERQEAIIAVREAILDALPDGYEEVMRWGMITYEVPLEIEADTYNGKPLMYAALASQKNHMSVYLTGIYTDDEARDAFAERYRATGKRYDVGKSCVRFRKLDDLPLEVIAEAVAHHQVDEFVGFVRANRRRR